MSPPASAATASESSTTPVFEDDTDSPREEVLMVILLANTLISLLSRLIQSTGAFHPCGLSWAAQATGDVETTAAEEVKHRCSAQY